MDGYPQDYEAIEAWSSTANARSRIQSHSPLSTSYPTSQYPFPGSDSSLNAEFVSGRSSLDHHSLVQQTADPQYSYTRNLSNSITTRRRASSVSSTQSCSSAASGNSDEKSLCAYVPDDFETSKTEGHWDKGASILHKLDGVLVSLNSTWLRIAVNSLSSATNDVKINAKAWSTIGMALRRHVVDFKRHLDSSDIHMEAYIKILKEILAFWIYSVDPSICQAYEELPPSERPSQFSQNRHELFVFTQHYHYQLNSMDEDIIYEQKGRLDDAFEIMVDKKIEGEGEDEDADKTPLAGAGTTSNSSRRERSNGVKRTERKRISVTLGLGPHTAATQSGNRSRSNTPAWASWTRPHRSKIAADHKNDPSLAGIVY